MLPAKVVSSALPVLRRLLPRPTAPLPLPASDPKVSLPCISRLAGLAPVPTVTAGEAVKVLPPLRSVRLPSFTVTVSAADWPFSRLLPDALSAPPPRWALTSVVPPLRA